MIARAHRPTANTQSRLPLSLRLLLLSVFLPEGFSFFVADLRLTVTRVILLALTPVVFMRLGDKIAAGRYRFVASDLLVPLASLYMFIGPAVSFSLADSLAHSGPVVLEFLIGYMATRLLLEGNGQALAFASFLCLVIAFVCVDALLDTVTGRYITREIVDQVTHYNKVWHVADETRFGLLRAAGPIEHPILFGFIAGIGLLIAAAVRVRKRAFCVALCAMGVVICLSSAPEQVAIMGFGLLAYSRITARIPYRWLPVLIVPLLVAAVLFAITDTPFGHLFDLLTIDPQTAYYRLYIWNMVGPAILQYPYFSVLDSAYDYQGSIDSVWLVLALSYGMPCSILTGLCLLTAGWLPVRRRRPLLTPTDAKLETVLSILLCLTVFMGFTVDFWGSAWILVSLLIGLRAHLCELGQLNQLRVSAAARAPRRRNGSVGAVLAGAGR